MLVCIKSNEHPVLSDFPTILRRAKKSIIIEQFLTNIIQIVTNLSMFGKEDVGLVEPHGKTNPTLGVV